MIIYNFTSCIMPAGANPRFYTYIYIWQIATRVQTA